jgi:hypothetical protein
VTGATAAALRQAAVAAVASEGGAEAAQDLGALLHSISPLNSASPQLAQTQTAPQTSGQLLDKWVDSHLDLNARGWTQTLARNVISALRTWPATNCAYSIAGLLGQNAYCFWAQ